MSLERWHHRYAAIICPLRCVVETHLYMLIYVLSIWQGPVDTYRSNSLGM